MQFVSNYMKAIDFIALAALVVIAVASRTSLFAAQMSAFDPKRTLRSQGASLQALHETWSL